MRFFTFLSLFAFQSCFLWAQAIQPGLSAQSETAYPVSLYKAATVQFQNLYNGRIYYVYDARGDEHQFFENRKWQNGVVMYDGQRYDSIPMLYDIVKDELIIRHFYGDHLLLQSEKVDYFLKDGHIFKRFESGMEISASMRTGFYDILHDGKTKLVVRRSKQRQEKIAEKRVIALFPEKDFYYIKKGDQYYSVRSKKSALGLFPDQKKALRKAWKDERIKYRKNREAALAILVATYDATAKP